jgi:membrane protease YdiL (CAAX protease family)
VTPGLLDLALVVVVAVGLPFEGLWAFRRLVAAVRAGNPRAKTRSYRQTIAMQWSLVGALILGWATAGRAWSDLGLGPGTPGGAAIGAAGLGIGLVILARQQRQVRSLNDRQIVRVRMGMGDVLQLLPATARERRWFRAVSVTAGICEEILFRGFLIWFFAPLVGTAGAVAASSVSFGLVHAYQGWKGIRRITIGGAVMAGLYVASGTLWAPILVHAAVDLSAGVVARRLASPPGQSWL